VPPGKQPGTGTPDSVKAAEGKALKETLKNLQAFPNDDEWKKFRGPIPDSLFWILPFAAILHRGKQ